MAQHTCYEIIADTIFLSKSNNNHIRHSPFSKRISALLLFGYYDHMNIIIIIIIIAARKFVIIT